MGDITITVQEPGLAGTIVTINGKPFTTISTTSTSVTASGYLPPWAAGSATVAVLTSPGAAPLASVTIPVISTPVSYDVASRFAQQAAWGPREDVIEQIQQMGMAAYVDEQITEPLATYNFTRTPRVQFFSNILNTSGQLRLRVAWALNTFLPCEQGLYPFDALPWEKKLEADAFGNYRQVLLDLASDANVTNSLNLPGNYAPTDPSLHPNQNFARELMQLFSIGTIMLNDDGTPQLDALGNPLPAYGQDTVVDISRALTGWNFPPAVDPGNTNYTSFGVDWSLPLVSDDRYHDQGPKTIFGSVQLPAGQGAVADRNAVLDAIFQHQNLPPFVSRILIQKLVKSQPSPNYVRRIAAVFKDDGNGVRGNLAAVVKAILLDPEARDGDTIPKYDDGFLQDPVLGMMFMQNLISQPVLDDQPGYVPGTLGEAMWQPPTVFSYYSPSYVVPGTTINSPEFQIHTSINLVHRTQTWWSMMDGWISGYDGSFADKLYQRFTTLPDLLDALNHMLFHGTMPQTLSGQILDYCNTVTDPREQMISAVFLAVNSDTFTVSH